MNIAPKQAPFRTVGGVSEVAILAPIKLGLAPGERRSYEQRLRDLVRSIQGRAEQGLPTLLSQVTSIHFGRIIILRPEHYLAYAKHKDVPRFTNTETTIGGETTGNIDEDGHRAWALILVEFDGDPRVYFRDIADYVADDFNRMFENCEDFPGVGEFDKFWAWLRRFQMPASLYYPIYNDVTTIQIKAMQAFRRDFDVFAAEVEAMRARGETGFEALWDNFMRKAGQRAVGFPDAGGVYQEGGQ